MKNRSRLFLVIFLAIPSLLTIGDLSKAMADNMSWLQVSRHAATSYDGHTSCGFGSSQPVVMEMLAPPPTATCYYNRAWARQAFYSGEPNITIDLLRSADCSCSDLSDLYFLGSAYVQIGDMAAAQDTWWEYGPHSCLYLLGQHWADESNHEQAIALYNRVLVLDANRTYTLRNLARSYVAIGDLASAEEALLLALDVQSNRSFVLYELADLAAQQKQYDRAEGYYIRALSGDVLQFRGFMSLAYLAHQEGKSEKAVTWCRMAGEMLSSPYELLCEGRLAYAQGDYSGAATLLREAAKDLDQDKETMFWLGLALLQLDEEEANRLFEQSASTFTVHHYQRLGEAYQRLGNIPDALWAYERALSLRPADRDLRHIVDQLQAQLEKD